VKQKFNSATSDVISRWYEIWFALRECFFVIFFYNEKNK